MKKRFMKFWEKLRNTFHWLYRDDQLFFGEIELLHGDHDIALPLCEYEVEAADIKEVWVSVDERCSSIPVCGGDDSRNWFNVRVLGSEVRVHCTVNTERVLLKWFILV